MTHSDIGQAAEELLTVYDVLEEARHFNTIDFPEWSTLIEKLASAEEFIHLYNHIGDRSISFLIGRMREMGRNSRNIEATARALQLDLLLEFVEII